MVTDNNASISTVFSSLLESGRLFTTASAALTTNLRVDALAALSLVGASSSFGSNAADLVNSLDDVAGTVTLSGGVLATNLTTPLGVLQNSYDIVELGTTALNSVKVIAGALNLSQGVASGVINLGDGQGDRPGTILFAELLSNAAEGLIADLDGTIVFQNGKFLIDLPTDFGAVKGTLDFGSGKLVSDLTTPFGDLDFAIDFPETAKFDLPLGNGLSGVLNLDKGQIEVDLTALLPGPEIVVPLSLLSGTIALSQGKATANIGLPFVGNLSTTLDLAAEVRETVFDFLSGISGSFLIGDGFLTANVNTDLGSFQGSLNVGQYLSDFIATLPDYNGTLTFAGGTIVSNLATPDGRLDGTFNYGQYLPDLALLLNGSSLV
jgi:hypothetical protein